MTDTSTQPPIPSPQLSSPPPPRRGRARAAFYALMIALAAGLVGAFAGSAFSEGFRFGPPAWHGRAMMGLLDPAQIEERADRAVRHIAIEVDATPDQQEKLRAVVKSAVRDLLPMREKALAARQRGRELLVSPNLDAAAIESFRAEHMALADTFSKRVAQALTEVASILTVEQRRKLADLLPPRPRYWRPWRRG